MADTAPNPKDLEKLQASMKAYIAKTKKAPKIEVSNVAKIGNEVKGERAMLDKTLKAIDAAPDA